MITHLCPKWSHHWGCSDLSSHWLQTYRGSRSVPFITDSRLRNCSRNDLWVFCLWQGHVTFSSRNSSVTPIIAKRGISTTTFTGFHRVPLWLTSQSKLWLIFLINKHHGKVLWIPSFTMSHRVGEIMFSRAGTNSMWCLPCLFPSLTLLEHRLSVTRRF